MKRSLVEKLSKRINSLREAAGEISNEEILKLIKNPSSNLKKVMGIHNNYPSDLIDGFKGDNGNDFNDSYVVEPANFMKYCICKASGVESGIDINKAVKDIENNVKRSEKLYKEDLPEYNYAKVKDEYYDMIGDEAEKLIRKGLDPKKILITGDDSGDETVNPLLFVIDSEKFAKDCGATELVSKIKPIVDRAKKLDELIILV